MRVALARSIPVLRGKPTCKHVQLCHHSGLPPTHPPHVAPTPHPPGIILKRQAKPTGTASGHKPRDLSALGDSVQKLCQVALPLARSLEYLQGDVDGMSKEYR